MGYQESFITTKNQKDFPKLLERVIKLGEKYYADLDSYIPFIITLKKGIRSPYFPKRTKFLYVVGDRSVQYDTRNFVNVYYPDYKVYPKPDENPEYYYTVGGWEEGEKIELDFIPMRFYCETLPGDFYDKDGRIYSGLETKRAIVEDFNFTM